MSHPFTACLLVGTGGLVGSLARYGLSLATQSNALAWPAGTFASNALGCLLIGLITEAGLREGHVSPEMRLLLATGFCGGFTTLSSYLHESAQLVRYGDSVQAALYFTGTLAVSGGAYLVGILLVQFLRKTAGVLWGAPELPPS